MRLDVSNNNTQKILKKEDGVMKLEKKEKNDIFFEMPKKENNWDYDLWENIYSQNSKYNETRNLLKIIKDANKDKILDNSEAELFFKLIFSKLLAKQLSRVFKTFLSHESFSRIITRKASQKVYERE
jgi:hypothetical protein